MANNLFPKPNLLLFLLVILLHSNAQIVEHSGLQPMNETAEQWSAPLTSTEFDLDREEDEDALGTTPDELQRRLLYWRSPTPRKYYISYGALSANRIPCPPRSGRSYYTHNCYRAGGPVHPYIRSCSAITRCRR